MTSKERQDPLYEKLRTLLQETGDLAEPRILEMLAYIRREETEAEEISAADDKGARILQHAALRLYRLAVFEEESAEIEAEEEKS